MSGKNVFIVGPGFIGWNVLELLVAEGYKVRAVVRRKEHAAGIEKSGAVAVIGDLDDKALIAGEAERADIVFHTATADHLPSTQAVLDGISRSAASGKTPIYSALVFGDQAKGDFKGDKLYSDDNRAEIDKVSDDAPHRNVDLAIVHAQKQLGDKAKIAIMVPSITRFALKHGYAPHVGKGLSVSSQIHVMDLSRAYMVLLHAMEQRPPSFVLENPYFFCENGKVASWKEVAEEVAKGLVKEGRMSSPNVKTIPEKDYGEIFGPATAMVVGANAQYSAVRLRNLGWESKEKGIWESFHEDELPALLKESE